MTGFGRQGRRWLRWRPLATAALLTALLGACGDVWNDPYPLGDASENALYTEFTERPKHLDPAVSYSEDEAVFNSQIYESPFQYHYLKRPYELIPATAAAMPKPRYLDKAGHELPANADAKDIALSVYDIHIRPGIRYQPHPAFVEANRRMNRAEIAGKYVLGDFQGYRLAASWRPPTTSTRSSAWRIRGSIRRFSARCPTTSSA